MQPAIETDALTKRFRQLDSYRDLILSPWRRTDRLAVDRVSLRIEQGELYGFLGQNGAGKTTLIKMLCTLLLPSSGHATVLGYDIERQTRRVRRAIGLISGEERSFFWRLTGRQNLEFFAALYHVPASDAQRHIDTLLQQVGLADHADQPFRIYSTGMRQKLAIARGLLTRPRLLFMDEPTRSLDPISAQAVRRLISDYVVGELKCTVVLATHSMVEAEKLCDRVAFIRAGRVVMEGSINQLRQSLRSGVYCELRVQYMPDVLPGILRRLPGVLNVQVDQDEAMSVLELVLCEEGPVLAAVVRTAVELGADVYGCRTREASMEEIYMQTLGDPSPAAEAVSC